MNNSFLFHKIRIYIKRSKNKTKIRNHENNRLLYSFIKIILLLLALIIFFILDHNICNINYNTNIKIFYSQNLSELVEKEKIENSHLISNTSCFPTENKLYWKNQTNLEIEKLRNDIRKIQTLDISLNNNFRFYRSTNPKISLIITIYNQDHYIKMIYASIQQQELKDIEIIFIDDASIDNSPFVIKDLMKLDKRISYIKNNINKKQFYSINLGVLYSKGEYILSIDPDDLLLNNILIKAYKTSKYYNLDILQFYMLSGMNLWKKVKYKNGIIFQQISGYYHLIKVYVKMKI